MSFRDVCYKIVPLWFFRGALKLKNGKMYRDWQEEDREKYLDIRYFKKIGKHIEFENLATFSEKMQYYKLYYYTPELKNIVCKYNFKKYVADKLGEGHTIPLLGAWTGVDAIDFDALPEQFVLKSNCCYGGKCIEIIRDKSACDTAALREKMRSWLDPKNTMINSLCRAYYEVTPMIIAEEYKEQVGDQLYDYKVFCFNGEPFCVYVAIDHYAGQISKISFYDLDWNELDVTYGAHERNHIEKPKHFDEMISYAKKLSEPFPFVRVDYFDTEEKLYLAEMTFYSGGGYSQLKPDDLDRKMGELFQLPPKNGETAVSNV